METKTKLLVFLALAAVFGFFASIAAMPMLLDGSEEAGYASRNAETLQNLIAQWTSERTPETARQVTFLIGDRLENVSILQPTLGKPGPGLDGWLAWYGRGFGGSSPGYAVMVGTSTPNLEWYADTRLWARKRDDTIRSLAEQMLQARRAQARVNLLAEGEGVFVAISALLQLEKLAGPGDSPAVAKAVFLGSNLQTLSGFPLAPDSTIREKVHLWSLQNEGSFGSPPPMRLEAFTQNFRGHAFQGNDLLGFAEDIPILPDPEILAAVGKMLRSERSIEDYLGLGRRILAANAAAAAASAEAAAASLPPAPAGGNPSGTPQTSLSGGPIQGGGPIGAGGPIAAGAPSSPGPSAGGGLPGMDSARQPSMPRLPGAGGSDSSGPISQAASAGAAPAPAPTPQPAATASSAGPAPGRGGAPAAAAQAAAGTGGPPTSVGARPAAAGAGDRPSGLLQGEAGSKQAKTCSDMYTALQAKDYQGMANQFGIKGEMDAKQMWNKNNCNAWVQGQIKR